MIADDHLRSAKGLREAAERAEAVALKAITEAVVAAVREYESEVGKTVLGIALDRASGLEVRIVSVEAEAPKEPGTGNGGAA